MLNGATKSQFAGPEGLIALRTNTGGGHPPLSSMTEPDPLDMLFRAKWNIPQASAAMGKAPCVESWEEVKVEFAAWCKKQPRVYTEFPDL